MRIDSPEFSQLNQARAQEPAFVVEIAFDDAGTDLVYLTSHTVEGLTGEIFDRVLTDISGTTQKINPDKALSEIGALSFSALDDGLTDKQRSKLSAGLGLRGKRARFYAGFRGLDWSTYTLVQTQIIRSASYKDLVYSWKCSDIQREMRKNVFEVKSTSLAKTLEPDDDEVEVFNTEGFQTVKQPPSPSGRPDAPGQTVGYIILEEDGQKEIIRYTGKTSTTFTGCTRGVLGTRPIRVEKSEDEGADNAPKVEEYVYLEMPAPMLAYAILTGNIYGEPGETLPDHWHLGIAPEFIRTSDYVNIGEDLWDLSNPDLGLAARIAGVTDEDGKQFVEEQFFLLMGCYAPIYANGEIGLRRMTGVVSSATATRTLDRENVAGYGALQHDMEAIINRIVISWNWVDQREEFTRTNLLIDQKSIDTHGDADLKQLEFRALHGSRHSYNTLRNRFDALRDRYAGPPLRISLELMPDQNDLEVGDIVRLKLAEVEDYTGELVGIDRAFEIQQVKVNWKTGRVDVELFGSSQKAEPLPPEQPGAALPETVYAVAGATEINATNFPGAVTSSSGITSITDDINLAGHDDLRDPSAIYYCLEDLTINAGVTVTVNRNTQLRVKGFFQVNGKIDGKARGWDGGLGMDFVPGANVENLEASLAKLYPINSGYIGQPAGGGGVNTSPGGSEHGVEATLIEKFVTDTRNRGANPSAREIALDLVEGNLAGLPSKLVGQPGSGGGSAVQINTNINDVPRRPGIDGQRARKVFGPQTFQPQSLSYIRYRAAGGAGGKSGAGLFILCSGSELGSGGEIDLSGEAGHPADSAQYAIPSGTSGPFDNKDLYGGRGAGGSPGAMYVAVVGATSNPPTLTSANSSFYYGDSSSNQAEITIAAEAGRGIQYSSLGPGVSSFTVNGAHNDQPRGNPNEYVGFTRIQFINGEIEPAPDVPEHSEKPAAILVTEALNTPKTPNANISTLEVSVTAPADSAYSYALVEFRPQGQAGWTEAGPASPEALITVASDGTTYDIRARSVSTTGVISNDFISTAITTTKIIGAEPGDPNVDEKIRIPRVRGLELEGQGNDTEFTGRDAKFVWRATSIGEWFEIGSEGQLGASAGELDLYFRDYQVEIWAQNKIVRTEWVKDPAFVYLYEKNAEDYARENGSAGAWRSFEIRVYCRGRLNQVSEIAASLPVSNPAPTNITGLAVTAGFNVIEIAYRKPADLDFAGVQVWVSETSGFDPDAIEPVATVGDNSYVAGGLAQGMNYYIRLRPFDDFGIEGTTPTAEIMVTTRTGQDLSGLSGWAYELDPVDEAFILENMEGDSVPSEKIKSLAVPKLTAGVINALGPITTESIFRAVDDINSPTVQTGLGPTELTLNGVPFTALQWSFNASGVTFAIDELGNPYFKGSIEASGFSNDYLEIDDQGNLTSTGTLRFGGATSHFIEFDGVDLLVDTPFLQLDGGKAVLGDDSTDQFVRYSGSVVELGPGVTIGDNTDRTVTVGPGGDYATINSALEALSRVVPAYKSGGFNATIELMSGFVLAEQIYVNGIDLSWITISSASGEIHQIDETAITENTALVGTVHAVWNCIGGGRSPRINFRMGYSTGVTPRSGIYCRGEGSVVAADQIYIENAGYFSILCVGGGTVHSDGDVECYDTQIDNGIEVANNSIIRVTGSLTSNGGGNRGLVVGSSSTVNVTEDINCNNNGSGIAVQGVSSITCGSEITCDSNANRPLFMVGSSTIRASSMVTTNNGSSAFMTDSCEVHTSFQWDASNTGGVFMERSCTARVGSNLNCGPDDLTMVDGCFVSRSSASTGGVVNVTPNGISGDGILLEFNPSGPG